MVEIQHQIILLCVDNNIFSVLLVLFYVLIFSNKNHHQIALVDTIMMV